MLHSNLPDCGISRDQTASGVSSGVFVRYKEKFRSDLNFGHAIVAASLEHDAAKAKRGLEVGGASTGFLCQRIERPDISINDGGQRERFLDPEPADHGAKQRAA